jgi:hypothetical protein
MLARVDNFEISQTQLIHQAEFCLRFSISMDLIATALGVRSYRDPASEILESMRSTLFFKLERMDFCSKGRGILRSCGRATSFA